MCEFIQENVKIVEPGDSIENIKEKGVDIKSQTSIIFPQIDAKYEVETNKNGMIFITKIC